LVNKGGNGNSTTRSIVDDLKIKHLFCDPDKEKRKKLGIPCLNDDKQKNCSMREVLWFQETEPYLRDDKNVIFVCGPEHCESFSKLVTKNNYPTTTLVQCWDKDGAKC